MATTFNQSQNEEVQVMLKLENLLAAGDLVIQQQIKPYIWHSVQTGYREQSKVRKNFQEFYLKVFI